MTESIRERQGKKAFAAEYDREQQQKEFERTAPIRAAVTEQSKLLAEIAATERQIVRDTIFKEASEYLAANCTPYTRADQTIDQIREARDAAIIGLKKYLLDEHGIEVQQPAMDKLARIYKLNYKYFDVTSLDNWKKIVKYLDDNQVFNNQDLKVVRVVTPPAAPAPASEPVDINAALEAQETTTREGLKAARKLAVEGLVLAAQPVFKEFADWLVTAFDYYISKVEADRCVDHMRRSNWRLDDIRNWHRCRKIILNLKTPDEVYEEQMEIDSQTLTSPEFALKYSIRVNRGTLA